MKKYFHSTLVFFLAMGILYAFLGDRLFQVDDYIYAFGGDAAILYYNMVYHSWYGSDLQLSNMNYPMGESLLMTDAQASVSFILNKLNGFSFIKNHIVGWVHGFHYFCFGLAAVFAQRTLSKLGVSSWIAIVGALLIVFMSPQILRIRAHYGLAYPIVFTSIIYAMVGISRSLDRQKSIFPYLALHFASLLFFGFNNIYLLILGAGLSSLYSLFHFIFVRSYKIFLILASAILSVLIVFIVIKSTDPEMQRIIVQWGYDFNKMTLRGLFMPFTSGIATLMGQPKGNIESACNVGLVNGLWIGLTAIGLLFSKSRNVILNFCKSHKELMALLLASLVILIYALGKFSSLASAVPAATMFKASGRFAWPFYYALTFLGVVVLDHMYSYTSNDRPLWKYGVIFMLLLWSVECYLYLDKHVSFHQYENRYSYQKLTDIKADLVKDEIDYSNYQAMYTLPAMIGWNDKYHVKFPWNTEYHATRLSMATGLPLINAMLSRMGLDKADQIAQMSAHPLIPRTLLNDLGSKPIMIVMGKDAELTRGENWIRDRARVLKSYKGHYLYHIDVEQFKELTTDNVRCDDFKDYWYYDNWDDETDEQSMLGTGCKVITADQIIFAQGKLSSDSLYHTRYADSEMTLAVFTDNRKHGLPWIRAKQYNAQGKRIKEDLYDVASSKNVQDAWRIASFKFEQLNETDSLEISLFNIHQDYRIDELLLRPQSEALCSFLPNGMWLIND